jgi:hypothetical protein
VVAASAVGVSVVAVPHSVAAASAVVVPHSAVLVSGPAASEALASGWVAALGSTAVAHASMAAALAYMEEVLASMRAVLGSIALAGFTAPRSLHAAAMATAGAMGIGGHSTAAASMAGHSTDRSIGALIGEAGA